MCNLLESNYLNFVSFSKCFIKLSLAVWWSTIVTLWLWNECKTAIFASTSALSFHSDVGVRVSKSIFIAIFCRLKGDNVCTRLGDIWEWGIGTALFKTQINGKSEMYTSNNAQRVQCMFIRYIRVNENVVTLIEKSHCIHSILLKMVWINSCLEIMPLSSGRFCLAFHCTCSHFSETKSIENWRIDVKPLKMNFAITLKSYTTIGHTIPLHFFLFACLTTRQFLSPFDRMEKYRSIL